jgi:flagella basal body P-ring formation protein FlgA
MKNILLAIYLILTFTMLYSMKFSLKDEVFIKSNSLKFSDLIIENDSGSTGNIEIKKLDYFPLKIKSNEILKKLFENNVFDITLSGKETIVYFTDDSNVEKQELIQEVKKKEQPVEFLEEYLANFLDKNRFKIKVNLTKIEPFIDIDSIPEDYKWEISKLNTGLKDIANLKNVSLFAGKKKYNVSIDMNIYADVWLSRQSFIKEDFFKKESFEMKNIDITAFKDVEQLVFDIDKAQNTKFTGHIGTGEILKWNLLKRIPLVIKDENLKILIEKNGMRITLNCASLQEAFENEKIKVKLKNGREKIGTLRKNLGDCYVELL